MTTQEIFDYIVSHLRAQNSRCINVITNNCLYRAGNGKKCAVGCLITNEEYQPEMEMKTFHLLINSYSHLTIANFDPISKSLLKDMQVIHDDYLPGSWEKKFRDMAERFNLIFSVRSN